MVIVKGMPSRGDLCIIYYLIIYCYKIWLLTHCKHSSELRKLETLRTGWRSWNLIVKVSPQLYRIFTKTPRVILQQVFMHVTIKKLRTPLPRGSSLCEGMGEGYCTQPYPCICKEAVSGFEPMTNKSPKHNFTHACHNEI